MQFFKPLLWKFSRSEELLFCSPCKRILACIEEETVDLFSLSCSRKSHRAAFSELLQPPLMYLYLFTEMSDAAPCVEHWEV